MRESEGWSIQQLEELRVVLIRQGQQRALAVHCSTCAPVCEYIAGEGLGPNCGVVFCSGMLHTSVKTEGHDF